METNTTLVQGGISLRGGFATTGGETYFLLAHAVSTQLFSGFSAGNLTAINRLPALTSPRGGPNGGNLLFCYLLHPAQGIGFIFVSATDGAKDRKNK